MAKSPKVHGHDTIHKASKYTAHISQTERGIFAEVLEYIHARDMVHDKADVPPATNYIEKSY